MPSLIQKIGYRLRHMVGSMQGLMANRRMGAVPLDSRVRYPSYMPLDEFIDVDRLKSLDGELRERIMQHLAGGQTELFNTGDCKMKLLDKRLPGSRIIALAEKKSGHYFDLNNPGAWGPSSNAADFAPLMEFIGTLPFKATARIIIMCDELGRSVTAHRDHALTDVLHEFIWFRTNLEKPFFVTDREQRERKTVTSHSAWFDTVNQYHGGDATGKLSFSIRVDGVFSDALREKIPTPACNPASTPSLWASLTI